MLGEATAEEAVLLSAETGLVGSPEPVKKKGKPTGSVKVKALLNPDIAPQRAVRIESRRVTGFYVVQTANHKLDSGFDASFYTEIEAKEL